jgi:hypothetical protein
VPSCCSGSSRPPRNAAASASPHTGHSNPGAGSSPNTPPRSAFSTGCSTTATSSSQTAKATACAKPDNEEGTRSTNHRNTHEKWGLPLATRGDQQLAVDTFWELPPAEHGAVVAGSSGRLRPRPAWRPEPVDRRCVRPSAGTAGESCPKAQRSLRTAQPRMPIPAFRSGCRTRFSCCQAPAR